MENLREGRRWARAFVIGEYTGPPVDYLMAIAIVYAAMVVTVAHDLIRTVPTWF